MSDAQWQVTLEEPFTVASAVSVPAPLFVRYKITCTLVNRTRDTLYFERAAIRVSSRNVRYQYNDKFLPIPWDPLLPQSSATHKITGREVTDASDWNKIAGERLSVSFKGLSLSGRELVPQTVEFIPENPKIGN